MGWLEVVLIAAALLAGFAGTWSPCGFSMIETIGPAGHSGGRATTLSACVTFMIGALVGGVLTFGALASLGALLQGADQQAAYIAAAVLALLAAVAELRGVPILPQLRRQLPEHWRRVMPMPVAAGLYGVLLGLGFTTFVLTFGVFALAGIVFAVGEPLAGIAVGLAFGIGRALPIALIAPIADRESGISITEAMAERPSIYRGVRFGDGLALVATAIALVAVAPAGAARTAAQPGADPSVAGKAFVFERPNGAGVLRRGNSTVSLPGRNPAIGDGRIAVVAGSEIVILSATDLQEVGRFPARHADAVAISKRWIVWREHHGGRDSLRARGLTNPASPGRERGLARSNPNGQLGRPSLDNARLVYARAVLGENTILSRRLGRSGRGARAVIARSKVNGLSNPTVRGGALLYVLNTSRGDRLKLRPISARGSGRTLLARKRHDGTLWSTALTDDRAYVTLIDGSRPRQKILSVSR
jgi:MFS family permease